MSPNDKKKEAPPKEIKEDSPLPAEDGNDKLNQEPAADPVDSPAADDRNAPKSGTEPKAKKPREEEDMTFSFDFIDEKFAEDKQVAAADDGKDNDSGSSLSKDKPKDAGGKDDEHSKEETTRSDKKRAKKKKNKAKSVFALCSLFSFLVSLLLVLTSVLVIVRIAVSEKVISKLAQTDEYYQILMESIETQAQDYTIPTGIDTSVPTGVFDKDEIAFDVMNYVHYAFNNTPYEPNVLPLEKRVNAKATAYYEQFGDISEETGKVIDAYAEDIADIYTKNISIIGMDYVCDIESFLGRLFPVFLFFLAAGIFLLIWLCIKKQIYPHQGLRFAAYASGGAALILLAGPLALYITKWYQGINLASYPLYYLATSLIEKTIVMFFIAAGIMAVVTIALIAIVASLKKQLSSE